MACSIVARRPNAPCKAVVLGEPLQGDVDRALQLFRGGVDDVGKDAALGRLMDVDGIARREQRDHRAGGLADNLSDQLECVFGGESEPDERNVGVLCRGDPADCLDVDLASDHLVAEPGDDLGEQFESVASLVGDQDPEMGDSVLGHRPIVRTGRHRHGPDLSALRWASLLASVEGGFERRALGGSLSAAPHRAGAVNTRGP